MSTHLEDSDSDLEIVKTSTQDVRMRRLDAIFDRIPEKQAKESHSLQALKMLAHLTSPGKQNIWRNKKSSMTNSEMQMLLQQKARQQAAWEREEKLQALRDKGYHIQTAEEREKEMIEVENLITKARREAAEITQREKAAAKKERKARGEADPLEDSSDDEDWEEEKENLAEQLSGSDDEEGLRDGASDASGEDEEDDEQDDEEDDVEEDEENDEMALDRDEAETKAMKTMFDNEADETEDDEAEADASLPMDEDMFDVSIGPDEQDGDDEEDALRLNNNHRRSRKSIVISDEEDDEDARPIMDTPVAPRTVSPKHLHADSPIAPNSVLRSATKTFIPGVTVAGSAGLGLTQIFAGTMDESQIDVSPIHAGSMMSPGFGRQNESIAFFKQFPAPDLPPFLPTMPSIEDNSQDIVIDSQAANIPVLETQGLDDRSQAIQLGFSQSQIHGFDSLVDPMASQMSELPDATQDVGFQHMTPISGRFVDAPPSTVETVVMAPTAVHETLDETPIVKKKGKLRRRAQVAALSDDEDAGKPAAESAPQEDEFDISANLFDVMRKASKKNIEAGEFDKKKSEAKRMVNEQAEESEDEYAGLGGASDDESGSEDDELVKEMIDDEAGKDANERELAAFFA